MTPQETYSKLKSRMKRIALLQSTGSVLYWDEQTYLPPGGADHRGEQIAQIEELAHDWFTTPEIGDWLTEIESSGLVADRESEAAVNVREWRRLYDRETRLPGDFVSDFARACSKANVVWREARKRSDFKLFQPHLQRLVDLFRRKADLIGYTTERYDALLDAYEPGVTVADIESAFAGLQSDLVELVAKIKDAPHKPDIGVLKRPYDIARQRIFAEAVAAAIGYDYNIGRIDEAPHPSCNSLGPRDIRILTRYYPDDLAEGLTGTVHEAGHALYDITQKNPDHWGTPMALTASLGIHESQSRMWENIVGRSKSFWVYFFPQLQRIFHEETRDLTLDDFYGAMNWVAPSYIRVEADEATYNLHIMLRFELERAIISGDIKVADIPGEWNARFKKYLGIEVDTDAHGCLQDIHWAGGSFGYFPTYALGNMYAAQFWMQAQKDHPGLADDFAQGRFDRLVSWLSDNIHNQGFKYYASELCERVTGAPLSHKPLLDYLYDKYEGIYGVRR